jgi:glycyl-tRNA synthetase alpha subunit
MWQAVAAWTAAFSSGLTSEQIQASTARWDEIIDLSVESGDDHAIKFTEACHRIEQLHSSPVFRVAASDWVHRVVKSRDWSADELVDAGIKTRLPDA